MNAAPKVRVRCEVCKTWLGEREVEEVLGECIEIPCRRCFWKQSGGAPAPSALEAEWVILEQSMRDRSIFFHPGRRGLIDVNMEYNGPTDTWIFTTPRKLEPAAFDRAKAHVLSYYQGILKDFESVGLDDRNANAVEQIEKALRALEANRVRNVVDPPMLTKPVSF